MKGFRIFVFVFLLMAVQASAQIKNGVDILPADDEAAMVTKAAKVVPSKAQLRWQQLELTAFFHFGINTFTDREWGTGKEDPALFNPSNLDARQWVRICKDAGIKQVILTAKHHDGFCLWPSAYTGFSVKSSPWKNGKGDVVRELSEACKEAGMGFGVYLSPWDRNSPLYGTDAYNDYFVKQLTELLTNYGRVDEVWFDGANGEGPNGKKQWYDFQRWYKLIRSLQPQAIIAIMGPDVRWVGNEAGKGRSQEWSVIPVTAMNTDSIAFHSQKDATEFRPKKGMQDEDLGSREKIKGASKLVWYPAETDVSIRPGWFYHAAEDKKVKTPQQLLNIYLTSVGKNSLLLLNIPPDKNGLIHAADSTSLLQWKALRTGIFSKNLFDGAGLTLPKKMSSKVLTDNKLHTAIDFAKHKGEYIIEATLNGTQKVNMLMLQENIATGQRVEDFTFEGMINGQWKVLAAGTTIGYKRIIPFEASSVERVRLHIRSSRLKPVIAAIGLYVMDDPKMLP